MTRKILAALVLILLTFQINISVASSIFFGLTEGYLSKNKYSLFEYKYLYHRGVSLFNLRYGLTYKSTFFFNDHPMTPATLNLKDYSISRYEKGNLTFLLPLKSKTRHFTTKLP